MSSNTWYQVSSPDAWTQLGSFDNNQTHALKNNINDPSSSKIPQKSTLHPISKPTSSAHPAAIELASSLTATAGLTPTPGTSSTSPRTVLPPPTDVAVDSWFHLPSSTSPDDQHLNWDAYVLPAPALGSSSASADGTTAVGPWETSSSSSLLPIPLPTSPQRNIDIEAELSRQNLYKTELCRSWVESAQCKYGNKCQFAHGRQELRPVIRHPKYKTEICKTFHTNGTCPYGKRCRFVHNPTEWRLPGTEEDVTEEQREIEERIAQLRLGLLAPDPVFHPPAAVAAAAAAVVGEGQGAAAPAAAKKTGSRLPFFQKLRKQKS